MWWRVIIYIIILGNVNGDETVSGMPEENHTTSNLASSVYLTSSTMTAPTQEIEPSSATNTGPTSIANDLSTVALALKNKVISRPSGQVFETSANISSSEHLVFSTKSYVSENTTETSSVSSSSESSVFAGSSSNVVTVHSTTLQPSTAPYSSIHSDSITSHQPEISDVTIVPSLTTEMTDLASQSETSSSVLLNTGRMIVNIQSTATDSVISSFSSLPTASGSQPLTSSYQPLTSSSQPLTSSTLPQVSSSLSLTSSTLPQVSSSLSLTSPLQQRTSLLLPQTPLTSSSLPQTTSSLPFTSSSLPPNVTLTNVIIATDTTMVTSEDFHSSAVSSSRFVDSSMAPSSSWSLKTLTNMETSLLLETSTHLVISSFVDNSVSLQNASDSISSSLPTNTTPHSSFQTSSSLEESVTTQLSNVATSTPPSVSPGLESSGTSLSSTDHASQHSIISSDVLGSSTGPSEASSIAPTHATGYVVNTVFPSMTQPVSRPPSVFTTISESVTSGKSQHSVESSASSTTTEFTAVTSSSSDFPTNVTVRPTATTSLPHPEDMQFVNQTFEMVFQGNCEPLVKDKLLLKAFWNQLQEKLVHKSYLVKADNIACEPLRITFTYVFIPQSYFKQLCTSLKEIVSDIHINVTISGQLEYYRALKLNTESTITSDKTPPPGAAGLEEIDLIVLIAAGSFCLVLILVGLVICIREYYHRKRTRTFEFANMYQAEDFTLTKIPRPAVTYTEKGADINTNGHSNGDAHETEKETLMESIQLRVNSNENGLMVGITGTLERQSTVSHTSPSPSPPGSEHLQLVPKEEEPLQSQDNPIYYIDDDHSE
eukprot:XP_011439169.1 PREDICTED: uncharacterized protein LOC105336519 isoform X2 [Crassostrea gigas]